MPVIKAKFFVVKIKPGMPNAIVKIISFKFSLKWIFFIKIKKMYGKNTT